MPKRPPSNEKLSLREINELQPSGFVSTFRDIFEHSSWVAERAWESRPFQNREDLLSAMANAVETAGRELRLQLMSSHPDLAGKTAQNGELTANSMREQSGAGLDACSHEELSRLQSLNSDYKRKFGFPFVLAVKDLDKKAILEAFEERIGSSLEDEFQENLRQITRIADFRLDQLVAD